MHKLKAIGLHSITTILIFVAFCIQATHPDVLNAKPSNLALNAEIHGPKEREVASGAEAVKELIPVINHIRAVIIGKTNQDTAIEILVNLYRGEIIEEEARRQLAEVVNDAELINNLIIEAVDPISRSVSELKRTTSLETSRQYQPAQSIKLAEGPSVKQILDSVHIAPLELSYKKGETLAHTIWNILSSAKVRRSKSVRDLEPVKDETIRLIQLAIDEERPIELFLLAFLPKFPNPLKSGNRKHADVNNIAAIQHMLSVHLTISELYKPGLSFIVGYEGFALEGLLLHTRDQAVKVLDQIRHYTNYLESRIGVSGVIIYEDFEQLLEEVPEFDSNFKREKERLQSEYFRGDPAIQNQIDGWVNHFGVAMYDLETVLKDNDISHPPIRDIDRLSVISEHIKTDALPEYLQEARKIIWTNAYEIAFRYWALQNVKYHGGPVGLGIRGNYPQAIPTTVRSAEKYNFSIIPGTHKVGAHSGVAVWHRGRLQIVDLASLQRHSGRFIGVLAHDNSTDAHQPFLYIDRYGTLPPFINEDDLRPLNQWQHGGIFLNIDLADEETGSERSDFIKYTINEILPHLTPESAVLIAGDNNGLLCAACAESSRKNGSGLRVSALTKNSEARQIIERNLALNNLDKAIDLYTNDMYDAIKMDTQLSDVNLAIIIPPTVPIDLTAINEINPADKNRVDTLDAGQGGHSDGLGVMRRMLANAKDFMSEEGRILILIPEYIDSGRLLSMGKDIGLEIEMSASVSRKKIVPGSLEWNNMELIERINGTVFENSRGEKFESSHAAKISGEPLFIRYYIADAIISTSGVKGSDDKVEISRNVIDFDGKGAAEQSASTAGSGTERSALQLPTQYMSTTLKSASELLAGRELPEPISAESLNRFIFVTRKSLSISQDALARGPVAKYFSKKRATKIIVVDNIDDLNHHLSFANYHPKNTALIISDSEARNLERRDLRVVTVNKNRNEPLPIVAVFSYADGLLDLRRQNINDLLPKLKKLYISLVGGSINIAGNQTLEEAMRLFDSPEEILALISENPLEFALKINLLLPSIEDKRLNDTFKIYKSQELDFLRSA